MKIFENEDFLIEELDTIKLSFAKNKFDRTFGEFLKNYPAYATSAVMIGSDAIAAYKSAKNSTARFFARTTLEKKLYKSIVDELVKTGKFKKVTNKYTNGGIFYELVKV